MKQLRPFVPRLWKNGFAERQLITPVLVSGDMSDRRHSGQDDDRDNGINGPLHTNAPSTPSLKRLAAGELVSRSADLLHSVCGSGWAPAVNRKGVDPSFIAARASRLPAISTLWRWRDDPTLLKWLAFL